MNMRVQLGIDEIGKGNLRGDASKTVQDGPPTCALTGRLLLFLFILYCVLLDTVHGYCVLLDIMYGTA